MIGYMVMVIVFALALFDDLREQKICIVPALAVIIVGGIVRMAVVEDGLITLFWDCVPGILSFIISGVFNECIGKGDCLLILNVGIINGYTFCLSFIGVSCAGILVYSVFMLLIGRMHRKSTIPCVPFLIIGYLGAWLLLN